MIGQIHILRTNLQERQRVYFCGWLWSPDIYAYPDNKLRLFLSDSAPTGLPAEKKMDDLYAAILHACDWDDNDFVEGYGLVMGAILAAKTPLSMSALQSLHRTTPALHVAEVVPR